MIATNVGSVLSSEKSRISDSNKNVVFGPKWGMIPKPSSRHNYGRIMTLT